MTQYTIDIGAVPDDGQGDPLRTAFSYVNQNFDQVFAAGPVLSNVTIANNTIRTTNNNGYNFYWCNRRYGVFGYYWFVCWRGSIGVRL